MKQLIAGLKGLGKERWSIFGGVLLFAVIVTIILIVSGCAPKPEEAAPALTPSDNSKYVLLPDTAFVDNIPARVDGIVVDTLPRIEGTTTSDPAIYRLTIEVNGVPGVYPVDAETWVKARIRTKYQSGAITLDCDPLPCVMAGGE